MKILLDEMIPHDLRHHLTGHHVETVQHRGWNGLKNGQLLAAASGEFDVLITSDRSVPRQNVIRSYQLAMIVLRTKSTRLSDVLPLVPQLLHTLEFVSVGEIREVP